MLCLHGARLPIIPAVFLIHERLANRTSPAPDYLNPRLELASARRSGFDRSESIDVQSIALKNTAVLAGQIDGGRDVVRTR